MAIPDESTQRDADQVSEATTSAPANPPMGLSEDWTATVVGLFVIALVMLVSWTGRPTVDWEAQGEQAAELRRSDSEQLSGPNSSQLSEAELKAISKERKKSMLERLGVAWSPPAKQLVGKPSGWNDSPIDAFRGKPKDKDSVGKLNILPMAGALICLWLVGLLAVKLRGLPLGNYTIAFPALFLLASLAYILSAQAVIKNYNLEYALWALLVGLIISNTVGTPAWLRPAVLGELYIKIGLVLLGAEVLVSRLLALGIPGIFVAWVVTPIVLVSTYVFGQRVLKLPSKSLNMVISADMSVCGVSAAIATAAACKAKKEELSLAIGLSLSFTVLMMIVMPRVVLAMGLDPVIGGAWMGGTIDATGAVVAAGEALGTVGSETAVTVKMIQNILIGITAFCVAVYWTRWVEPNQSSGSDASNPPGELAVPRQIGVGEIWKRFPKFVLGFIAASLFCSAVYSDSFFGESWIEVSLGDTKTVRGWLFCLAFVCIGLETNFRELAPYLRSGKPLLLYLCGQTLNILLTLAMAYLMFGILFPQ